MTDTTTPEAAPVATPSAEPAAPAAAVPAATPPAPEPAAQPDPAPAPAPAAADSLLPPSADVVEPTDPAADPDAPDGTWFLSDGIPGKGEPPEWYKAEKYKTLAEQAKAYASLESRFGAFTGAPPDGKYNITMPEGIVGEFDIEHPIFNELQTWAKDNQFSQEAMDGVIDMFARYEASLVPDMTKIKEAIGKDADERITRVSLWAKANLGEEGYDSLRDAMGDVNADKVFKVIEGVIAKTRQPAMPKSGDDVISGRPTGMELIQLERMKKNDQGQFLYDVDATHREKVFKMQMKFAAENPGHIQPRVGGAPQR